MFAQFDEALRINSSSNYEFPAIFGFIFSAHFPIRKCLLASLFTFCFIDEFSYRRHHTIYKLTLKGKKITCVKLS